MRQATSIVIASGLILLAFVPAQAADDAGGMALEREWASELSLSTVKQHEFFLAIHEDRKSFDGVALNDQFPAMVLSVR